MIGIDPTWLQTIRQQMQQYQQATDAQIDAVTYHQALNYPRSYGYGPMVNPLLGRANNSATALFSGNPFDFLRAQYMMQAPGGQTIGLPGDGADNQNPDLIAALLSRSGTG